VWGDDPVQVVALRRALGPGLFGVALAIKHGDDLQISPLEVSDPATTRDAH
jgi:hypothetical protein